MSEVLGKIHFFGSIIFMNGIFLPMFAQGLAGVSRRLYDGGEAYLHAQPVLEWNQVMTVSALLLTLFQVPFLINFFRSIRKGEKVSSNPWEATTLEWSSAPSPPVPHGNFPEIPEVYRDPYEYSVPVNGEVRAFVPQGEKLKESSKRKGRA